MRPNVSPKFVPLSNWTTLFLHLTCRPSSKAVNKSNAMLGVMTLYSIPIRLNFFRPLPERGGPASSAPPGLLSAARWCRGAGLASTTRICPLAVGSAPEEGANGADAQRFGWRAALQNTANKPRDSRAAAVRCVRRTAFDGRLRIRVGRSCRTAGR